MCLEKFEIRQKQSEVRSENQQKLKDSKKVEWKWMHTERAR